MNIFWWQTKELLKRIRFWGLIFAPVGIGWTLTEIAIAAGYDKTISPYLNYLWFLLIFGLLLSVVINWPKKSVSTQLPNIDTEVEVRVGNIFQSNHPIVVTIPTTLETDFVNRAIDRSSIQGQYTIKYCQKPEYLANAIQIAAEIIPSIDFVKNFYSPVTDIPIYPPGEVFVIRDFSRVGYLLTFATFNEHGIAQLNADDFVDLLPNLWLKIRERGDVGNIDLPLIGSRFGRIGIENRREILRELINSFSVACAEARLADKVTFYITPADFTRWGFTFEYIQRLLHNICDDHRRKLVANGPIGQPAD